MQQENQRSISFKDLSWTDVDVFVNQHKIWKDRSSFVEYCIAKEIHKKRFGNTKIIDVIILLMLAMITLVLLLMWVR